MSKIFTAEEVATHNTAESCWVVLYGNVYDVTSFLPEHPGGSKIILKLAGRDATEEYDPIHPEGTLDELPPEAKLGTIDPKTLSSALAPASEEPQDATEPSKPSGPPPLEFLMNMNEIEEAAASQISRKAWAYYFSASDDMVSKNFNNAVYNSILLRPRMFVDCSRWDTSTALLGHPVGLPLFVAPAAMARLAHADGEAGIARACSKFNALQILSQNASMKPEQVVAGAAPGQVFGWQLYVQNQRSKSEAMLKRIGGMRDKFKFIVLTLDAAVPGKRELDEKQQFLNNSAVTAAVGEGSKPDEKGPGVGGVGQQLFFGTACDLTWQTTLPWLAKHTDLPIVLKGIQTHEDAYLAAQYAPQVKGIILSNHGGRALDTAPPAVHTLLEIRKYCPEVLNTIEVWVDGGIKRGTDIVKALCLGAKGVGIGRGALYGLGAGGQKGVERVFDILKGEVETCMRLLGVEKVSQLGPRFINTSSLERDIYNGPSNLDTGLWTKAKL
ncbi:hypothetical protein MKZ38_007121 [Zalerion maritima]|uniref:L-lactate dehydrogenase (cytochrome) n=1 Tax=Zalerion maritima TaxID=339359 RepID=A0AAD5RI48_9PEZI|nr:hypothetical protein MKZ38_007121 [Zalerion maritima]